MRSLGPAAEPLVEFEHSQPSLCAESAQAFQSGIGAGLLVVVFCQFLDVLIQLVDGTA